MEYFVCPCPGTSEVLLDGVSQGANKDSAGNLLVKLCNEGLHIISLRCNDGKICVPQTREVDIRDTDPICPREVPFTCV
jgi:hypothetical protein